MPAQFVLVHIGCNFLGEALYARELLLVAEEIRQRGGY